VAAPGGPVTAPSRLVDDFVDAVMQVNNRTGEASKALAVVGAISIPFVVISGMWGMNFERIPLSQHPHGFAVMMAIQLAIGLGLLVVLRRRGLL